MNVEQILTEELRVVTGFQAPPPPSIAEVSRLAGRERGRVRRSRLAVAGLVAAAVVAVIVLGSHVGRPAAAPQPAKPSPSYYADGVPYFDHGGLFIDHQRQPGDWRSVESYGDFSVAVAADQTAEILQDGKQVMQIDGLVYEAALSFDGTKAAWIAPDGQDKGVLVVRDLVSARELGRLPLVLRATGDQGIETSLVVRNDGTAYYEVGQRLWKWQPGAGGPVRADQAPNGVQTHPAGFSGIATPVRLSPDHLWGAWITDQDGRELGDLQGKALGVTVQKPDDPGSRFTMPLPTGLDLAPITFWDTPTEITFPGPENVRCDIVARKCRTLGTS